MKRQLSIIILCICLLMTGCQKKETSIRKDITVEGSIFSGEKQGSINTEFVFNDAWITSEDNTKFNSDLAKAAILLSADSYFREKDLDKNAQNRVLFVDSKEDYDYSIIFKTIGFEDATHIESFKQKEYEEDTNDSVTLNMAYKNVDDKYDAFIVVIRGTFSAGEWSSSVDCGACDNNYFNLSGKHSQWENTNVYKGIDVLQIGLKNLLKSLLINTTAISQIRCY